MFVKVNRRFGFLVLAYMFFGGATLRAQSPTFDTCCSGPGLFCDVGQEVPMGAHAAKNYVDSVIFDGPISLTEAELQPAIESLKVTLFERDPDWLDTVRVALRQPWLDQGYFNVKVIARSLPVGGDDGRYAITAHVDEGAQYRVKRIDVQAVPGTSYETIDTEADARIALRQHLPDASDNTPTLSNRSVFPPEQLRALIPLQDGEILSDQKMLAGIRALNQLYGRHGFIDFVASPVTRVNDVEQTYTIRMDLNEGRQYRIGEIGVLGLDAKTQAALLWNTKTGDVLDYELVQKFFDDNKANFPAGSYMAEDLKLTRHAEIATADITYIFQPCPSQAARSDH